MAQNGQVEKQLARFEKKVVRRHSGRSSCRDQRSTINLAVFSKSGRGQIRRCRNLANPRLCQHGCRPDCVSGSLDVRYASGEQCLSRPSLSDHSEICASVHVTSICPMHDVDAGIAIRRACFSVR